MFLCVDRTDKMKRLHPSLSWEKCITRMSSFWWMLLLYASVPYHFSFFSLWDIMWVLLSERTLRTHNIVVDVFFYKFLCCINSSESIFLSSSPSSSSCKMWYFTIIRSLTLSIHKHILVACCHFNKIHLKFFTNFYLVFFLFHFKRVFRFDLATELNVVTISSIQSLIGLKSVQLISSFIG